MNLIEPMRGTFILMALLMILCGSCNEKIYTGDVDCEECYTEEPENADLIIELTISNRYPRVPIVIYKGNVEDNQVIYVDTVDYSPVYAYVPVDRKYSVKAEYKKDDKTLFAVDGTKLSVKVVSNACEESCYVIDNEKLDARLKKEFSDF
jgi:hypothetical protein